MDYFSLCLDGLCLAGQAFMHMIFVSRLTKKKTKVWYFAEYGSRPSIQSLPSPANFHALEYNESQDA